MVLLQARRPAHAVLPAQQAQPVARARRVANLPSAAQVLPVPHPRGPRQPMQQALPARAACQPAVLAHPVRQRLPAARVLLALPVPPVRLVPLAQRGPAPRPMLQVLAPEVHPAAQVPPVRQAARRAHPVLPVQPAPRRQVLQAPQQRSSRP